MRSNLFYGVVLATALFVYMYVLFILTDQVLPGILGLMILPPIIWATDALGLTEMIREMPKYQPPRHRSYTALRSKVTLLLDVVRRINWLAVDLDRGFRGANEVEKEMDQSVELMKGLVDEIREVAGRTSLGPEEPVAVR